MSRATYTNEAVITQGNLFPLPEEPSFHNTIGAKGTELNNYQERARSLQARILVWWKMRPGQCLTPLQVWDHFKGDNIPEISVKRAITNLTTQGKLIKTTEQKMERRGVPNHLWRLNLNG